MYKQYANDDIHYVVGCIQKGLKPYTEHGLKRVKRKNARKQLNTKSKKATDIAQLTPQSPEAICMKALRTEFLEKFKGNKQLP